MRKAPRQARSKATVDTIVEAGARVLGDLGWAGFTTNKVAETAGVSIGSLYQYFPDKLSLIDTIRRRHLEDSLAVIRGLAQGGRPLRRFVEELVDGMVAAHSIHPRLHRVLLDEVPGYDRSSAAHRDFEAEYLGFYAAAVAPYLEPENAAAAGRISLAISDAIDGVVHNAARRGTLGSQQVRQELVGMLCLYLSDAGAGQPG